MKRILTSALKPGMVAATDVVAPDGRMLMKKGSVFNDAEITRLDFYDIIAVNVENETQKPASEKPFEMPSFLQKLHDREDFKSLEKNYQETATDFANYCNDIVEKNIKIDVQGMLDMVEAMIRSAKEISGVFDIVYALKSHDDMTYVHCMNVAMISNLMATWLGMSQGEIEMATLCGLFHDIGKLSVPKEVLMKKTALTDQEWDQIKNHTMEGYNILMKQRIDDHIKNTALLHHERTDGSGYPLGITGDKTDRYAKIVAIADVYDAITSPRPYRDALCPFLAVEMFENEGLQKYEPQYVMTFLENVVTTYVQNKVMLSNGEEGRILMINRDYYSRPLVQTESNLYDLRFHKELHILSMR